MGRVTVPMPPGQRAAFLRQVAPLPASTRTFLVVASAAADAPLGAVLQAAGRLGLTADSLAPAEQAGVVTVRPTRIRFRHPLLQAAVYQNAPQHERLAAHRELADAVDHCDPDAAVLHRATATFGIDGQLADALEQIAKRQPKNAIEIALMLSAARLSDTDAARHRRTLAAALAAWRSGHMDLAQNLGANLSTVNEPAARAMLTWLHSLLDLTGDDPVTAFNRLERVAADLTGSMP